MGWRELSIPTIVSTQVYLPDVDHAKPSSGSATLDAALWEGELNSWHDYFRDRRLLAPIEPPAGLSVERTFFWRRR